MNGSFQVKTDPGMKLYRTYREMLQKADEQSGSFRRYREFKDGNAIEVFEDPLASRPIQAVNLNRVDLRGKWIIDIDEDPETGEACLIFEDPMTKSAIHLWVPSPLDRTALVDFSINPASPVEQRPNRNGIDYETILNEKIIPEEPMVRRVERVAVKALVRPVIAALEQIVRVQREFSRLQERLGLARILSWVRF